MDRDTVLTTLREVGAEILGVTPGAIVEDARFKEDLDADSLDLVEVVMALEERLEIAIPEDELSDIATVGQALDVVEAKLSLRT